MTKEQLNWTYKDTLILLIVPIELLLGRIFTSLTIPHKDIWGAIFVTVVFTSGFLVATILKREILKHDFHLYKERFLKNSLISIAGAIIFGVIVLGLRNFLPVSEQATIENSIAAAVSVNIGQNSLVLAGGITAVLAPFTEEIVFRHVLLYKFKDYRYLRVLMLVISSLLFGLAHYENFVDTPILILPLILGGFVLGLLYLWKKNIWINIFSHLIHNFIFGFLPSIVVLLVH